MRFAADMCQHDDQLARGDASGLLKSAAQYVRGRLQGDHLPLVSLLALFHKVGFQGEVRSEIEVLCGIVNRNRQEFVDAVRVVRESPGFVVQAGRYWYVTPEIVTGILFREGWRRWVESGLPAVFERLPGDLRQQLIDRAARFGGEEVRGQIASFFRGWFGRLTVKSLADPDAASLAAAIIRSSPEEYLGKLRHLIDGAAAKDLLQIKADWNGRVLGTATDSGLAPGEFGRVPGLLRRLRGMPVPARIARDGTRDRQQRDRNLAESLLRRAFGDGHAVRAADRHPPGQDVFTEPGRSPAGIPRPGSCLCGPVGASSSGRPRSRGGVGPTTGGRPRTRKSAGVISAR